MVSAVGQEMEQQIVYLEIVRHDIVLTFWADVVGDVCERRSREWGLQQQQ
jgi:hypothetical protein